MAQAIYDHLGRKHNISNLHAVGEIFKLKEKSGSNPWPVIQKIIEVWQEKNPQKWESYLIYLEENKKSRKVTNIGNSRFRGVSRSDRENDAITRYTADIPQPIMYMMRAVYSEEEMPMTSDFFAEFTKKFPAFRVMEKLG